MSYGLPPPGGNEYGGSGIGLARSDRSWGVTSHNVTISRLRCDGYRSIRRNLGRRIRQPRRAGPYRAGAGGPVPALVVATGAAARSYLCRAADRDGRPGAADARPEAGLAGGCADSVWRQPDPARPHRFSNPANRLISRF